MMQSSTTETRPKSTPGSKVDHAEPEVRYLAAEEMPLWDTLVEASPQGSVFCRSWWLEASATNARVLGYFEERRLIAGIPLTCESKYGIRVCGMPKYTAAWGVVIEPLSGKLVTRAARETEILKIFAQRLATESFFVQSFHPTLQNWLPFYWNGFRQTTRFLYAFDELNDLNRLWDGFSRERQADIRKSVELGLRFELCDSADVFAGHPRRSSRSLQKLSTLCAAAKERDSGECFAVKDKNGQVQAANLMVWDAKNAYLFTPGFSRGANTADHTASALLTWHLIQFCAERSLVMSLWGALDPLTDEFFRSFGARQIAYNWIVKAPLWLRVYLKLSGKF